MENTLTGRERPQLEEMTLRQLRRIASEYNIYRYSRKRKHELLSAIQLVMRNVEVQINKSETIIQEKTMEPTKFDLEQEESLETTQKGSFITTSSSFEESEQLLPGGYGDSKIVLMPRDSQWAYTYWDISNEYKQELRRQGGQTLILRLYDVTKIDINLRAPHSVQEYICDELAREWYLPIPVSNRDYIVEIGYRTFDGNWLVLARSIPVRIPPLYPSQWVEDVFVTVNWEDDLRGKTVYQLVAPEERYFPTYSEQEPSTSNFSGIAQHSGEGFGSELAVSSYVLGEGVGSWSLPTVSGKSVSSYVLQSNVSGLAQIESSAVLGYSASGAGILGYSASGIGMQGFSASAIPQRPRKFWLVADAELIVYGATEPDATVTIGGRPIKLNEDGTFRFQMSFQDGLIDCPIMAVAVDGEQTRSIHMKFNRETPSRNTNTKEEATLEWL